jgi:hypothetical protein
MSRKPFEKYSTFCEIGTDQCWATPRVRRGTRPISQKWIEFLFSWGKRWLLSWITALSYRNVTGRELLLLPDPVFKNMIHSTEYLIPWLSFTIKECACTCWDLNQLLQVSKVLATKLNQSKELTLSLNISVSLSCPLTFISSSNNFIKHSTKMLEPWGSTLLL